MEKTYKTNEVSKLIGIHPNTVRMYEDWGLISKPMRKDNGYRVFTDLHIDQFKLARTALQIEVVQNGLRKKAIDIVKLSALCKFEEALSLTNEYILLLQSEIINANEAVRIAQEALYSSDMPSINNTKHLKRKEVSILLGITIDTLRNWEMNGLIKVKRKENRYRVYTNEEIRKLKIIRSLKCANYSLSAILRMMNALEYSRIIDVGDILNSPNEDENVLSACDKLVASLESARDNAVLIKSMLIKLKNKYSNPPL